MPLLCFLLCKSSRARGNATPIQPRARGNAAGIQPYAQIMLGNCLVECWLHYQPHNLSIQPTEFKDRAFNTRPCQSQPQGFALSLSISFIWENSFLLNLPCPPPALQPPLSLTLTSSSASDPLDSQLLLSGTWCKDRRKGCISLVLKGLLYLSVFSFI